MSELFTGSSVTTDMPVGAVVSGFITGLEERDRTDMNTGEIRRWSDGRPVKQHLVTLDLDSGDVGVLYVSGRNIKTFRAEIARVRAKSEADLIGRRLDVKRLPDGEPAPRQQPPKVYAYRLSDTIQQAPTPSGSDLFDAPASAAATPAAAQVDDESPW